MDQRAALRQQAGLRSEQKSDLMRAMFSVSHPNPNPTAPTAPAVAVAVAGNNNSNRNNANRHWRACV